MEILKDIFNTNTPQRTFNENVLDIGKNDSQLIGMIMMSESGKIRRIERGVCYIGPSPTMQLSKSPSVNLGAEDIKWLSNFTNKWKIKKYVIEDALFNIYLKKDMNLGNILFEADNVILYPAIQHLTIVYGLNIKANSISWLDRSKNFDIFFRECNIDCDYITSTTRQFPTFMYCNVRSNRLKLNYDSNTRIDEYIRKGDLKTPFKDLKISNNSNINIDQLVVGTENKTYFFWDILGRCIYKNAVIKT